MSSVWDDGRMALASNAVPPQRRSTPNARRTWMMNLAPFHLFEVPKGERSPSVHSVDRSTG